MTLREKIEELEFVTLSPRAMHSRHSRGRERAETPCPMRTCYMRDRDRVIHSKAFRRLKHKTQVFVSPEKDHYRTRLTHTLEVAQISRTVARCLRLNEDLTEAIALAHDLGHTPFGHAGERALAEVSGVNFSHNAQSVRVLNLLERDGHGLNLSFEVLDGVLHHTGEEKAATLEGRIVSIADRIAYINHDIDDAIRADVMRSSDIPAHLLEELGGSHGERIDSLVRAMVDHGLETQDIGLPVEIRVAMDELRDFMFDAVYLNPAAKSEESKGVEMLKLLYGYFEKNPELMPDEYIGIMRGQGVPVAVCDYIAGMTDRYAVGLFKQIFIPQGWNG